MEFKNFSIACLMLMSLFWDSILHPFNNDNELFAATAHLWAAIVPFLKGISNAAWAVIYLRGLTWPTEAVIGSLHILTSFQTHSGC